MIMFIYKCSSFPSSCLTVCFCFCIDFSINCYINSVSNSCNNYLLIQLNFPFKVIQLKNAVKFIFYNEIHCIFFIRYLVTHY